MSGFSWRADLDGPAGGVRIGLGFTDASSDFSDAAGAGPAARALVDSLAGAGARSAAWMGQVHGARAVTVEEGDPPPEADALVTTRPGLVLLCRAADCVPVLLADPAAGVVAAVHCGREGLRHGVLDAAVAAVREHGGQESRAVLGPRICGRCYEVPATLRTEVAAAEDSSRAVTRWGTPGLDLGRGAATRLTRLGCHVEDVGRCTYEDPGLHSHRRDAAAAGRLAGAVWIAAPQGEHGTGTA